MREYIYIPEWRHTEYEFNKAMTNSGKTMVNIIHSPHCLCEVSDKDEKTHFSGRGYFLWNNNQVQKQHRQVLHQNLRFFFL